MTDEQNIEQPVLTPIAADSYRGLAELIALMVDPKAFAAKLRSLQEYEARAAKMLAELSTARAAHDGHVASTSAEIKEQMSALAQRRADVEAREGRHQMDVERHQEAVAAFDRRVARYEDLGGGLVRDAGYPTLREPAPRESVELVHDADFPRIAPAGASISRSIPRSRRAASEV